MPETQVAIVPADVDLPEADRPDTGTGTGTGAVTAPRRQADQPLGSPWPASAQLTPGGEVLVSGVGLDEAADRFGTPLYVLDEAEVRARAQAYRRALPHAEVLYAAKAFLCSAMADWVAEEGLGLDVCSAGELRLATAAGFRPSGSCCTATRRLPRSCGSPAACGSDASSSTAWPRFPDWPRWPSRTFRSGC